MSQRELARRSGKNISTISFTLQGKTWGDKYPPLDDIEAYARALGVPVAQLRGDETTAIQHPAPLPIRELLRRIGAQAVVPEDAPFFEDVIAHAGKGGSFPDDVMDALPIGKKGKKSPLHVKFSLRVHGDCMEPDIRQGDVVVFDRRVEIRPGRIVVALVNMEETVIRRIAEDQGYRLLVANQHHDPIPVDWRVQIAGVAVGGQYVLV